MVSGSSRDSGFGREIRAGITAAAVFAALFVLSGVGFGRAALGAVVLGLFFGWLSSRPYESPQIPTSVLLAVGLLGVGVSTYGFLFSAERPQTLGEWAAVLIVFCFMFAAVLFGVQQMRTRADQS